MGDTRAEKLADAAIEAWKNGDLERAETLWQEAAELGSSRAMVNLGRNRVDDENVEQARTWFLRAVDAGNPDGAFFLANLAMEAGDAEEAEAWRWKAADLGDGPTLWWLANREADPDPTESFNVELMTRAAETGSYPACRQMCMRSLMRGDSDECIDWGERALKARDQEDDQDRLARLHWVLAAVYESQDELDAALRNYESALNLAPSRVDVDLEIIELMRAETKANRSGGSAPTVPRTSGGTSAQVIQLMNQLESDVLTAELQDDLDFAAGVLYARAHVWSLIKLHDPGRAVVEETLKRLSELVTQDR